MELNGEEKTIRALFREMKLEDERAKLTFAREWKSGPAHSVAPFRLGRGVFAAALVSLILVSTLVLQRQFFGANPPRHELTTPLALDERPAQEEVSTPEVSPVKNEVVTKLKDRARKRGRLAGASRNQRIASLRRRNSEAAYVSDWQSPTRAFLSSPSEELIRSVPSLNQSSVELGSFLHSRLN